MLDQDEVDAEEERLRDLAGRLPDDQRREFFRQLKRELRDPDTYAVLNWFFLVGLHHFYLGRWGRGLVDLVAFLAGTGLLIGQQILPGAALILLVVIVEMGALFRAQIIVQDWNNRLYRSLLARHGIAVE